MSAALHPPLIDLDIEARLIAGACRSVRSARKMRVRRFIKAPWHLDTVYPDLSRSDRADGLPCPRKVVAVGQHMLERELSMPHRSKAFGGEIPLMQAQAVLLYGRALRLYARRLPTAEVA